MSIHEKGDQYRSSTFGKSLSLKVDGGFNAISINPSARDVVLASRQGLYIIDLDDPFSPPRWLPHVTPWQVADVQWCPHPAKPNWVVSTSNQKAIIWNLTRSSSDAIEYALHGHSRAITDINFNPQHPDILATCSIDTYVHAWDMRSPSRPFYSTSSWRSSASQVKWNFKDSNILASSHGNDVFIWDLRNGSTPLHKLEGHQSSVNSIDFNRFRPNEIMSCSNDGTVKFWNYAKDSKESTKTVSTDFPIWRGRYLPFGEGCCVMPMVGGNNSVYLMNLNNNNDEENGSQSTSDTFSNNTNSGTTPKKLQPIYTFKGHTDRVIDFLWRSRHSYDTYIDDREFELVTWSKDWTLRLWPISDMIYDKVNFERNKHLEEKLPDYEYITYNREVKDTLNSNDQEYKRVKETFITTSGLKNNNDVNHLDWLSGVRMNDQHSPDDLFEAPKLHNLGEEVSSIGHKFPKVVFEKISVSTGELVLTLNGPWSETNPDEYVFIRIEILIPQEYPNKGNAPIFKIEENGNLTSAKRQEMVSKLKEIGKLYTDADSYCLEQCLHYLLGEKVNMDLETSIDEPIFNFDITDNLDFDEFSSLTDSGESDHYVDSSSDSDEVEFKEPFSDDNEGRNTFGRNLAFDTTPVPNRCGAIWTATGQVLCFFSSESKADRKPHNTLKLTKKILSKKQNKHDNPLAIYDEAMNITTKDNGIVDFRPKRYVDTFAATESISHTTNVTSDEESVSDDSFGSFVDDWNDVIGNDVVFRTKMPTLLGNFGKTFGSVRSESVKTGDSNKFTKNSILTKDFSYLIPENRDLALEYEIIDSLPEDMARKNALVAEKFGLEEISHCWQILSDLLMNQKNDNLTLTGWNNQPIGLRWFVKEAIDYFEKHNNVQMLAMICCVIANPFIANIEDVHNEDIPEKLESTLTFDLFENKIMWQSDMYSQYSNSNTIINPSDLYQRSKLQSIYDSHSIKSEDNFQSISGNRMATNRRPLPHKIISTNGVQDSSNMNRISEIKIELLNNVALDNMENPVCEILDIPDIQKCRRYIYQYARLLYRWGLPMERVKILKISLQTIARRLQSEAISNTSNGLNPNNTIDVSWLDRTEQDLFFKNCNYCNLRIKGNIFVCGNCQHILHATCANKWWEIGDECPSGCGCHCPDVYDVN